MPSRSARPCTLPPPRAPLRLQPSHRSHARDGPNSKPPLLPQPRAQARRPKHPSVARHVHTNHVSDPSGRLQDPRPAASAEQTDDCKPEPSFFTPQGRLRPPRPRVGTRSTRPIRSPRRCTGRARGMERRSPAARTTSPSRPTTTARSRRSSSTSTTPVEISPDKNSNFLRTPAASTQRPLDDHGLRRTSQARPGRHAFYAVRVPQVTDTPPASFPPHLTVTQLPSARGYGHLPHRGLTPPSCCPCRAYDEKGAGSRRPPCP